MSLPKKALPKKCQFNTKSYGIPHQDRRNSGTKSQVPINQIYNSTFDFDESISIIKTRGWRLQLRENCEKCTEYRKPPRGETNKFLISLFSGDIYAIFYPSTQM